MKKIRLLSIFSILVVLVSAAILTGCGAGSSATASAINAAGGGVGTVSSVTVTDSIETSGSLDSNQLVKTDLEDQRHRRRSQSNGWAAGQGRGGACHPQG